MQPHLTSESMFGVVLHVTYSCGQHFSYPAATSLCCDWFGQHDANKQQCVNSRDQQVRVDMKNVAFNPCLIFLYLHTYVFFLPCSPEFVALCISFYISLRAFSFFAIQMRLLPFKVCHGDNFSQRHVKYMNIR